MDSISHYEIHELVEHLPAAKLPEAYRLLRKLAGEVSHRSPQVAFLRLPLAERRRLLAEQARQMAAYYEQTVDERQDWQAGEFQDDNSAR